MTATKNEPRLRITKAEDEVLKRVETGLFRLGEERGYIVLGSQWMKNPLLPQFVVAVMPRKETEGNPMGYVRVGINEDHGVIVTIYGLGPTHSFIPAFDFPDWKDGVS